MKVLIVFAHPRRDSYTGAVMDALMDGLTQQNHSVGIVDIYKAGFEVRFQTGDFNQFHGENIAREVRSEQARVDGADALAFVFPVWWWSFPAALKGWIDRVFSAGWAYKFEPEMSSGLLRDRPTLLLGIAGSRESTYRKYGYDQAMKIQLETGIFGYCGVRDVETKILFDVEHSAAIRTRYLVEVAEFGRTFLSAIRKPRVPEYSSTRISE